jgi:hypothetical protein
LRPGRSLTWRALTSMSASPRSSSTCHTGFQLLAGGVRHHLGDAFGGQPVGQRLQSRGEGRVGADLLAAAVLGRPAPAHRPRPRPWPHPGRRSVPPAAPPSTPPHGLWGRPAGPTDQATLKDVLTATVRGPGKAPASVVSTGSVAPRKAELGRATRSSSLVAATSHVGLISYRCSALCGPAFPQVTAERQARSYAFSATSSQAVQASQTGLHTLPSGNSSISLPAVAEAWRADGWGQALPEGRGLGPGRRRHPDDVATAQRRLNLLQWAIPALTGAVLVVNACMGGQQRPAQVSGGLLGRLRPGRAA